MENTEFKNKYENTSFFRRVLKIAAEVAASRFRLIQLIHKAFSRLANPEDGKSLRTEAFDQLRLFLRMLKAVATRKYKKLPLSSLVRIVTAVIYFVMIVDIIPDFIPVAGFADDAFILAWTYNGVKSDLDAFEAWENKRMMDLEEDSKSESATISPIVEPVAVAE